MTLTKRIESTLHAALDRADPAATPPRLAAALRHAVFPGGARLRPTLCLAVAKACGDDRPALADAAAAAIELLHCASLVHDDLPCFDNADLRRGRPSVHAAFGEPLAVLTGDALIVLAFEELARAGAVAPRRLGPLVATVARGVGPAQGIVAGQAWESEPAAPIETYHQAKTGALFVAATMGGAVAAGRDPEPWRALGALIGEAYQVADDLLDASAGAEGCGKPVGQDAAFGRPNMAAQLGVEAAMQRLKSIVRRAVAAVPECDGAVELRDLVKAAALRLAPSQAAREAAA